MITELIIQYPRLSIIILAAAVSFFISLINYFFMDKERLREIKSKQKELQKEMKEHQKAGNHDKVMEINKEMMSYISETFKHSLKPMLITVVPVLIFFTFIKGVYVETAIAGTWFWWYIITAIISSMIFRKLLKLP